MDHLSTYSDFHHAFNIMATKSVLLVAHGERGGRQDNAAFLELAQHIDARLDGVEVQAGVMKGSPSIRNGWDKLTSKDRYIYPFFMSDGFFVSRILPQKIREAVGDPKEKLTMLPPFGISPALGPALLANLRQTLVELDRADETPPLLIAAHGASIDKQSSRRANELARFLMKSGCFSSVSCAFLDEDPHLRDVVTDLDSKSLVLPLFNGLGSHSIDDMAELQAMSPQSCHYLPPVGAEDWVVDIVARDISRALFGTSHFMAHQSAAQ
ncbi:MAG: hypothetical protein OIF56_13110 [Cohaesibacter sp.]|nr:hypothetical protein [Cohaesibacter sp.]